MYPIQLIAKFQSNPKIFPSNSLVKTVIREYCCCAVDHELLPLFSPHITKLPSHKAQSYTPKILSVQTVVVKEVLSSATRLSGYSLRRYEYFWESSLQNCTKRSTFIA